MLLTHKLAPLDLSESDKKTGERDEVPYKNINDENLSVHSLENISYSIRLL
jgi:hypothetical protein